MNTNSRADTNRENALHSTGPRTDSGKRRSSLNALRHGLSGQTIVLPTEDMRVYKKFTQRFHDELKPSGVIEEQLVQRIADANWRLNRAAAYETNLIALGFMEKYNEIDVDHPQVHAALAIAAALREQTRALANLSIHEQRLARQLARSLDQLTDLQNARLAHQEAELQQAANLLKMHEREPEPTASADPLPALEPYDPHCDGFVFTIAQVRAFIARQERRRQASAFYKVATAA